MSRTGSFVGMLELNTLKPASGPSSRTPSDKGEEEEEEEEEEKEEKEEKEEEPNNEPTAVTPSLLLIPNDGSTITSSRAAAPLRSFSSCAKSRAFSALSCSMRESFESTVLWSRTVRCLFITSFCLCFTQRPPRRPRGHDSPLISNFLKTLPDDTSDHGGQAPRTAAEVDPVVLVPQHCIARHPLFYLTHCVCTHAEVLCQPR